MMEVRYNGRFERLKTQLNRSDGYDNHKIWYLRMKTSPATNENKTKLADIRELIKQIPAFGDSRVTMLDDLRILELAAELPSHYDNQIAEDICAWFTESKSMAFSYRQSIGVLRKKLGEAAYIEKKEKKPTSYSYRLLFKQILGDLPRDIFSGKCMTFRDGLWEPAENYLSQVKSYVYDLRAVDSEYEIGPIDHHYFQFECEQDRRLIPEIPIWDGVDRIKQMAICCELDGTQRGFTSELMADYLKLWLSGVFKKLDDPGHQNPVLILKGPQGIGKDVFIDTLSGGFEQWSKDLILSHNDKDNYTQLSRAAVLRIAEFERTSKTDLATIKDMIFRKFTFLRPSYKPEFKDEQCRASFVASCNTDDIYRDSTGNRRYAVFNLAAIDWNYENDVAAQKQILAQAQALAESGFKVSEKHETTMRNFLTKKTPESQEAITVEKWENTLEIWIAQNPITSQNIVERGWITNKEADEHGIWKIVTASLGLHLRTLRQQLKSEGLFVHRKLDEVAQRGYLLLQPRELQVVTAVDDDDVTDIPF